MKNIVKKCFIVLFLILPMVLYSQTRKISGTLVAFNKFPVMHVTIKAKKAKSEARSDENGRFVLEVMNKEIIIINDPVFIEYRKKLTGKEDSLNINLIIRNDEKNLETVVQEGYMTRQNLDYGRKNLWKYNSEFYQFTDAYDAIKYALPECTIITENGQKGIQFRGPKSIAGSNSALILVNGVIVDDVSFVTPVNITKITKLSPSAAALFGSRAANGVISIETK